PGASRAPEAARSMCRTSSRAATSRANLVFPLPAQPTTTTRSGTGRVGTGRPVMPMTVRREGQAPRSGRQLGMQPETTNKVGEIVETALAQPVFTVRACGHQATLRPRLSAQISSSRARNPQVRAMGQPKISDREPTQVRLLFSRESREAIRRARLRRYARPARQESSRAPGPPD